MRYEGLGQDARRARRLVRWLLVLAILLCMGSSVAYAIGPYVDAARTISQITGVEAGATALPTFTPAPSPTHSAAHPLPTPIPTALRIRTPGNRVNFLILASDNDSKFVQVGTRLSATSGVFPNTQVMIFVSLDPVHKQLYVISIPRDLWVTIPGYGSNKISLAAGAGNIKAAIATVEQDFGVGIDYYAWVGLRGFIRIIDSVGGIDINVIHPMVENDFPDDIQNPGNPYSYRRFFIPPGPLHMDGQTAELYVRARHSDQLSDFGRSQRQQQVLLLLKEKVQRRVRNGDFNLLALITRDLQGEALTNLHPIDILGLAGSLLGLRSGHIHRWTLPGPYTADAKEKAADGTEVDALAPNWALIRALFACVDSDQATAGCGA